MNEQFRKYLDMIASMTVDCIMGGITADTYMLNLETAIPLMKKELEADK